MAKSSVVRMSELYGAYRWDAECYEPEVLRDENALARFSCVKLGEIAYITDGQHGYHEVDEESPIRHITARCVEDGVVTDAGADRLSKKTHDANLRSQLEVGDVLLSTAGTIGEAGIVGDDILPANIDQDVARIALRRGAPIDPHFLVAFLRSELGQFQCRRATTGQIQGHISLKALRDFDIPIIRQQKHVIDLMREGIKERRKGLAAFAEAEAILTETLGMDTFDPSPSLFYSQPFSAMKKSRRFGAEYFMPSKERAFDALAGQPGRPLGALYSSVRELFDPKGANSAHQVRNFDLTDALEPVLDDRVITTPVIEIGSTKKVLRFGDVVVSRLRSYLREIALVRTTSEILAVGSTEFIVLRPIEDVKSRLTPETLLIFLRSLPVQTILKWSQDGSQHPRFAEADLLSIPVPQVVERMASRVDSLVNKALDARVRGARLRQEAKFMVERLVLNVAN